jgi:hypothetical protein
VSAPFRFLKSEYLQNFQEMYCLRNRFQARGVLARNETEGHAGVKRGTAACVVFTEDTASHITNCIEP